ncbi:acyltransferase domain-containing protein [Streptomyces sp. M19]
MVSGDIDAVDELLAAYEAEGVRAKRIPVDYASHSTHIEGLRERLLEALSGVEPKRGDVPVYSTVTGTVLDGTGMDAEYWFTNLRQPVLFERATRKLVEDGHAVFVECSPHPCSPSASRRPWTRRAPTRRPAAPCAVARAARTGS